MSNDTIEIFISYSKQDKELRDGLLSHLRPLEREGIITWHDRQILPGTEWDDEIRARLNAADIILLLLSADFLATDYCTQVEIPEALRRHETNNAIVMPVILRSCGWKYTPLAAIQAYPEKAKPIKSWSDIDEAYTNVVDGVYLAATEIKKRRSQQHQAEEQQRQQLLAQQEAEQRAERERLQREQQRQAEEEEKQHQAEQLNPQEAEASELLFILEGMDDLFKESPPRPPDASQLPPRYQFILEGMDDLFEESPPRSPDVPPRSSRLPFTLEGVDDLFEEFELPSEREIGYTRLRDFLKAGQWKEADQETADRMCEVMGRQQEGWLRAEDLQNFPCADLRTIDQLWVKHSQGRFGFSVQKKIWQSCGSPIEYKWDWEKFGEAVGWKKKGFLVNLFWISYGKVTFGTAAPKGHLPAKVWVTWLGWLFVRLFSLLSRPDL